MKLHSYARKKRQLSSLVKEIQNYSTHQQKDASISFQKLIIKTKKLILELAHIISQRELKRMLGTAVIFLGIAVGNQSMAQSFKAPVLNPFGLETSNDMETKVEIAFAAPAFVDINNDGDMDLFLGNTYPELYFFENIGSASHPQFALPIENPFGLISTQEYRIHPTFADIDGDGDMDLFVGENFYNTIEYYENIGTASDPQFAEPEAFPFDITPLICGTVIPSFADLDNDGDFDLFIGGESSYGFTTQYLENIGTATNPQFSEPMENPFGLNIDVEIAAPTFVDLDGDADIDLLIGEFRGEGNILYFENIGTVDNPQFADPLENPFGLSATDASSLIGYTDLDHDGDLDLMVGEDGGSLEYFENTEISGISPIGQSPHIKLFPNPLTDVLNIETEGDIENIEISNILGDKVLSIQSDFYKISVKDLKSGMYTAKISMLDKHYTIIKFVKK